LIFLLKDSSQKKPISKKIISWKAQKHKNIKIVTVKTLMSTKKCKFH
jgi:hypothetical protein